MKPLRSLLEEIHRRSLWQVLGGYAVVGWVILQVVDQLVQQSVVPGGAYRLALWLVLLGFPIVLLTAAVQGGVPTRSAGESAAARFFTWRRVLYGAVAAAAAWGVVSAVWLLTGAGPDESEAASEVSPSAVAVLPFSFQGTDAYAYLGTGMVSLLSTKIDGAGNIRTVDPRAILGSVDRDGGSASDVDNARQVASRFGAGHFVLGDIVEVDGQLQISARAYRSGAGTRVLGSAAVSGSASDIFALVDEIAADLLTKMEAGIGGRVRRVAGVTTSSLPAFKAYLEGEDAFRAGHFADAVEAFQRAVELDSLYALAFYRLSVAAEWNTQTELSQKAAERAATGADRLSDRDRLLLDAHMAWRRGAYDEAESRFRSFVSAYPEDSEAWFQFAEVLFHANPLRGRPLTESRVPFERVLSLEPDHTPSLIHLARVAARQRDVSRLDSLVGVALRLSPGSDRQPELRALRVYSAEDADQLAQFVDWLKDTDDLDVVQPAWNASYASSVTGLAATAEILTQPLRAPEVRVVGHLWRAMALVAQGRWRAGQEELDRVEALDRGQALEHRVLLALLPYAPTTRAELRQLQNELAALDIGTLPRSRNPSFFFTVHEDIHGAIREYLLGRVAVRLGDNSEALRHASALDELVTPVGAGTMPRDMAAGIRAEVLRSQGRTEEALAELEGAPIEIFYHGTMVSAFVGLVDERFVWAELLAELGRNEEALDRYENLVQSNPSEFTYLPVVLKRRARLLAELGEAEAAEAESDRLLALWSDPDRELIPWLQSAQTVRSGN